MLCDSSDDEEGPPDRRKRGHWADPQLPPEDRGPDSEGWVAVPTTPALRAPPDAGIGAHDGNQARRLVQEMRASMEDRIARRDTERTWSGVFVTSIWLAVQMHRDSSLIPALTALSIGLAPFRALGEHFDRLGLRTPAQLAEWMIAQLPTIGPRAIATLTRPTACRSRHIRTYQPRFRNGSWQQRDRTALWPLPSLTR